MRKTSLTGRFCKWSERHRTAFLPCRKGFRKMVPSTTPVSMASRMGAYRSVVMMCKGRTGFFSARYSQAVTELAEVMYKPSYARGEDFLQSPACQVRMVQMLVYVGAGKQAAARALHESFQVFLVDVDRAVSGQDGDAAAPAGKGEELCGNAAGALPVCLHQGDPAGIGQKTPMRRTSFLPIPVTGWMSRRAPTGI